MNLSRRNFLASATALSVAPWATAASFTETKKKLVMIAGTVSHGPGAHEFNAGVLLLKKCLLDFPGLKLEICLNGYPKDEKVFEDAAGVLLYSDGGAGHPYIQKDHAKTIDALAKKGVGLMCAHFAVEVPKDKGADEMREWIGGCYEHEYSCNPMWSPEFKEFPKHPVCNGVKPFTAYDEWYFNMRFRPDRKAITPLLTAVPSDAVRNGPYVYPRGPYKHIQEAKGRAEHMMWAVERSDGGRGVGFTGGHVHKNWQNDDFRKIVLNALVWICKLDVPAEGVASRVLEEDITKNLDPKPQRQ
ncbi:ThuA domain-containing protein [Telmatocola sphagniphila]|uniref:ThuA domain-containing protein n=1 Tax=Telmatocola sphagniphila TaxID=1123043 RepID=A0A8E6EY87_9BACT|nr:ThuA domain-containing protein [Telmatocola sphagniphila]QVL32126.1 ThuA domain-containing protein [Telmatocola sphagniphila]